MLVRPRQPQDMAACVAALAAVHAADAYPGRWPTDPAAWLTPRGLLAAWVATDDAADDAADERALGHAALCAVEEAEAAQWPLPAGFAPMRLAEVCRLFVAPDARGHGLGRRLLQTASAEARRLDMLPALKVVAHDAAAVALYERAGWLRVASVQQPWAVANPSMALLHTYIAPA